MASFAEYSLNFSGGREVVDSATAERLIQEWKEANTIEGVRNVNISNKSYTSEASELLADLLASLPTELVDVNLSDIIASRPEEDALITLRNIGEALRGKLMQSVNLSDNALGAKGIEASKPILETTAMEHLFLCNVGLSKEACELVAEILLAGELPNFRTLHFYNNMSGSGGATAISKVLRECNCLKDFRFSATRSSSDGCLALAESLAAIQNLEKLDLSDNTFGTAAAKRLGEALCNHSTLVSINFRDDGLTDRGIRDMLKSLSETKFFNLINLDLSGNDIEEAGVASLATWLASHAPALQTLELDDNELGSKGVQRLSKLISQIPHLKHLSLNCCDIGGRAALSLARAVAAMEQFQRLDMNGNHIPAAILEEIQDLFERNGKTLGEMDENDDDEAEEGEEDNEDEDDG